MPNSILSRLPAPDNATLLDAALAYSRRGWSIIPTRGKLAAGLWKPFQKQPADESTLRKAFGKPGITGLAVITGVVSGGLAIRDFDQADAYDRWAAANPGDAAGLPTVRTARGFHVYGRLDEEVYANLCDGELRADSGHYVLLPPSIHPDGAVYTWTVPLPPAGTPLPSLPLSLTQAPCNQTQADPAHPGPSSTPMTSIAWWTSSISSTLPSGPGQRNQAIFKLARQLKAIKPDATPAELRGIAQEWHRQALPFVRTKDFSESWADFAIAWERIRRPAGQSFATAAAATDAADLPAIVEQLGYDGHLRQLAALCWQLARQWGDTPFPLGCEIAGRHLGASTRHAGRLLKALQFDGVLKLITKGSKKTGKASEWRFIDLEQGGTDEDG